jgi:hypothetical protein
VNLFSVSQNAHCDTEVEKNSYLVKKSILMRSINTPYFRQNNSLILKLTNGQRKNYFEFYY